MGMHAIGGFENRRCAWLCYDTVERSPANLIHDGDAGTSMVTCTVFGGWK
jgi:hypothetical protein